MDYIITNESQTQYIRQNNWGSPIICDKMHCQVFPEIKAKHIVKNLPRTMQKFNFKAVPISSEKSTYDIKQEQILQKAEIHAEKVGMTPVIKDTIKTERKSISGTHELCSKVENWLHKVEDYKNLSNYARQRKIELIEELSSIDKKKSDIEHEIEFTKKLDACTGYKKCKELQSVLQKRRDIKDEIFTVELITDNSLKDTDNIIKSINGLRNRKYEIRVQNGV